MDANKLLTDAMKREANRAISEYVKSEIHEEAREQCAVIVQDWLKSHTQELKDAIDIEMQKRFKRIIKDGVDNACRSIRW